MLGSPTSTPIRGSKKVPGSIAPAIKREKADNSMGCSLRKKDWESVLNPFSQFRLSRINFNKHEVRLSSWYTIQILSESREDSKAG